MKKVAAIVIILWIVMMLGVIRVTHCWDYVCELSPRVICIKNLKLLDAAKTQWVLEHPRRTKAVPTMEDLKPYLKDVRSCPAGGTYTLGPALELPKCSVKGHELQ